MSPLGLTLAFVACIASSGLVHSQTSVGGGAGHALIFSDHAVVAQNFKGLDTDAFTFEAWLSTSDYCHRSAIASYSINDPQATDQQHKELTNHFVIFDPLRPFACHDFELLDLWPDWKHESCYAAWNHSTTANFVSRKLSWHHIAVTWTKAGNGTMKIYEDGLLMAETPTGKTSQMRSGGAFMLGQEQDCYAGCTDKDQAFYGLMDEVRVWRVERTQEQIMKNMRLTDGPFASDRNLVAYWKFNDPDTRDGVGRNHLQAIDSSTYGNHLTLVVPPEAHPASITKGSKHRDTNALSFEDNYALNEHISGMPTRDFTVSFWAKTAPYNKSRPAQEYNTFLTYATHIPDAATKTGRTDGVFVDDAIRVWKYYEQFSNTGQVQWQTIDTVGSLSVHINGNRDGNGQLNENWLDYAVQWVDGEWHHVAVTWIQSSGETQLYFDGVQQTPFWHSSAGDVEMRLPSQGGVNRMIGGGTNRLPAGSLVLGQNQECYGGCFSPSYALHGEMADVRMWDRSLSAPDVQTDMWAASANTNGLKAEWKFDPPHVSVGQNSQGTVTEASNKVPDMGKFLLWSDSPRWEYSSAPLTYSDGVPLPPAAAGAGGHAIYLNDQQVMMISNFEGWPSTAITVEFWMWSVDTCRWGSPISYAAGSYEEADNQFLLFNYNDWGVSVMEDEGVYSDHTSGLASTDGTWHHIAVSWQSSDGRTSLYDNGRKVWSVVRGKGKSMPSGGTLVIGREQDCPGGCFDSHPGATGKVDATSQEYGAQDFFGAIDEIRIWRSVRSEEDIIKGMNTALRRTGSSGGKLDPGSKITSHPDLVAYWDFDEGQGYLVKDKTGHGHDLTLTHDPEWLVVRWMAVCGDGVIEGPEECDDGNTKDGDGCSKDCLIENGWDCSVTSPSLCTSASGSVYTRPPPPGRTVAPPPPPGASGGGGATPSSQDDKGGKGSSGGSSSKGWIIALVLSLVAVGGIAGGAFVFRDRLADMDIRVPDFVTRAFNRRGGHSGLDYLDPEEDLDLAPEFVGATRPPQGGYQNLPGN
ncbi:hypothetical protein WJX73_005379 [Symbiochloris irregularis]|uniref:Pentraxin (PTX) domain-containing protein n=1 Tax=Symbiochloris irregularis TaxID=706552 RepID=A0AAW1NK73_9CHLO